MKDTLPFPKPKRGKIIGWFVEVNVWAVTLSEPEKSEVPFEVPIEMAQDSARGPVPEQAGARAMGEAIRKAKLRVEGLYEEKTGN